MIMSYSTRVVRASEAPRYIGDYLVKDGLLFRIYEVSSDMNYAREPAILINGVRYHENEEIAVATRKAVFMNPDKTRQVKLVEGPLDGNQYDDSGTSTITIAYGNATSPTRYAIYARRTETQVFDYKGGLDQLHPANRPFPVVEP